jgi:alkylated DNA repair dioxygenase AlkB
VTVQTSLFDDEGLLDDSGADPTAASGPVRPLTGLVRHRLALGAWVDLLPGWLTGLDDLLPTLLDDVPWHAERRPMYDRVVDVPRLLCFYAEHDPLPHPALGTARSTLNEHYADELGEPFTTAGLCLYRDGADSVAWHGDTIGRGRTVDTMVAILSLGSPRDFLLRPRGGGAAARAVAGRTDGSRPVSGAGTIRHTLQHGDLIVMGGSCQRTWEHAIPKTTRPVGPRVSIQFRPRGVR